MEPNIEDLKLKREKILKNILKEIKKWDKTYEVGITIIESIDLSLEELKETNNQLESKVGFVPFDAPYETNILAVQREYAYLLEKLEIEKEKLLDLIKETRLKEKVKNNYILKKNESIFIDKDL